MSSSPDVSVEPVRATADSCGSAASESAAVGGGTPKASLSERHTPDTRAVSLPASLTRRLNSCRRLRQVGASHLTWDPWRYVSTGKNPGWHGEHTWGVGLDDREEALLLNTSGSFELNVGWIDTTNLAAGHYVLTLVSSGLIDVLRPDADLSVLQSGGILAPASSVNGPVSIEFDIDE